MNLFKIKFFPVKIDNYIYFCLSNFIFIFILISEILFISNFMNKNKNKSEAYLFIPKLQNEFEEKRDLIFNQLSLNKAITSINKVDENGVKKLLYTLLQNTEISDNIIPEIYDLTLNKERLLDITIVNEKIAKIIKGTLILKVNANERNNIIMYLSIILITVSFILFSNYFLIRNFIFKSTAYLRISRLSGAKDNQIIKNLNLGLFVLLIFIFYMCYLCFAVLLKYNLFHILTSTLITRMFIIAFIFYTLLNLCLFTIQLSHNMKKINKL